MNANELRLKNIVVVVNPKYRPNETGKLFSVVGIAEDNIRVSDGIDDFGQLPQFIVPVKLSEEWFKNFGFEKDIEDEYLKDCFDADCSFFVNNPNTPFSRIDLVNGVWFFRTPESEHYPCPKYVHKFQNWWYESTGESLQLSST